MLPAGNAGSRSDLHQESKLLELRAPFLETISAQSWALIGHSMISGLSDKDTIVGNSHLDAPTPQHQQKVTKLLLNPWLPVDGLARI